MSFPASVSLCPRGVFSLPWLQIRIWLPPWFFWRAFSASPCNQGDWCGWLWPDLSCDLMAIQSRPILEVFSDSMILQFCEWGWVRGWTGWSYRSFPTKTKTWWERTYQFRWGILDIQEKSHGKHHQTPTVWKFCSHLNVLLDPNCSFLKAWDRAHGLGRETHIRYEKKPQHQKQKPCCTFPGRHGRSHSPNRQNQSPDQPPLRQPTHCQEFPFVVTF